MIKKRTCVIICQVLLIWGGCMKIINLRMHQLRRLKELELPKGTLNTEALMLILNKKQAKTKNGGRMLLKYLDAQDDEKVMARKMYTINMLNGSKEYQNIEELIIPDHVVVVEGKIAGFAMPLMENHRNLGNVIKDDNVELKDKFEYLSQVGNIIHKVKHAHDKNFIMRFGDLNEFNFIIDSDDKVNAIDLDSAYVGQDEPSNSAYYLLKNPYIKMVKEKYKANDKGILIPSENTDLYCYNMIILHTLAKEPLFKVDMSTYYNYLEYLREIGIDKELVECFSNIYLPVDNINPRELLSNIKNDITEEAKFKTFKKEYKINK